MRKSLLLLTVALTAITTNAQDKQVATIHTPGTVQNPLTCVSANGKWAAGGNWAGVSLINLETNEETLIIDSIKGVSSDGLTTEFMYDISIAAGITNDGMVVGTFGYDSSSPAAYLPAGSKTWKYLPVPAGYNTEYNSSAMGVTPDGKSIIGYGYDTTIGMYSPLLWTLQSDGSYAVEKLPCPDGDIWGSRPQMVVAYGISNDGTRGYGKMVDFTGYSTVGVIFMKGADGTWTCQTVGEDYVIKGTVNPGPQPQFSDYVTAEPGTPEYNQQDTDFQFAMMDWWAEAEEYANLTSSPAYQILVNQNSISGNGKYVGFGIPGEGGRIYNLDDMTYSTVKGTSGCSVTSIADNGDVYLTMSMSGYASPYFCEAGKYAEGAYGLTSWLESAYDVKYGDDTTEGDASGLGVCCASPDGKAIVGFKMIDTAVFSCSWVKITDGTTGIQSVTGASQPALANGILNVPGGNAEVSLYDATGCKLASFTAGETTDLTSYAKGFVMVRVSVDGQAQTFKTVLR